jgi:hypothetical protein
MVSGMNFVHHISKGFQDIGCGYTPSITHTMAHELGHGIFGLDHIFSGAYGIEEGATHNLMDYTEKTPNDALSYHEWTQINRPLPNWSALSRAEEDMWDPKSSRITSLEDTPFFEFYFDDNQFEKYITYEIGSNNIPVPWCYTPIGMVSGFSITCQKDLLFDKSKITQSKEGFKLQELTLSKEYKLVNEYTLKFIQDNANVGLNRIDIFADDTDHSCSINVIACKKKKYTIKLLVDPSYENFDFNSVVESFNRVFGPLNVEANFTMQELDINFELVDIEKDGVLHKETESKLLKNQIKTEENTYYILFINRRIVNNSMFTPQTEEQRESDNKQNDSDLNSEKLVGGFAVRNRQYPEMNNDPIAVVSLVKNDYHETVVHESGHLIFGLYDVYKDSYNTFNEVFQIGDDITNIMDYVEGSIGGEMHRFLKAYQVLQIEQIDEEFINIK